MMSLKAFLSLIMGRTATCASTAKPTGGSTVPRPMRAMRSMKPGMRTAMPKPPQAPHWRLVATPPAAYKSKPHPVRS